MPVWGFSFDMPAMCGTMIHMSKEYTKVTVTKRTHRQLSIIAALRGVSMSALVSEWVSEMSESMGVDAMIDGINYPTRGVIAEEKVSYDS